jgi:hypothetical protein
MLTLTHSSPRVVFVTGERHERSTDNALYAIGDTPPRYPVPATADVTATYATFACPMLDMAEQGYGWIMHWHTMQKLERLLEGL